jgi:hypothetical protein
MAIEIAATQTKSACADWVITGVANPDLVLTVNSAIAFLEVMVRYATPTHDGGMNHLK